MSDQCTSRFGRQRPFILGGAVPIVISVLIIGWRFGDTRSHRPLSPGSHCVGNVSSGSGLVHVDVIVLDEVHYLSDISRGTVWEEIIISGLQNFDKDNVASVVTAADKGGATHVDIACDPEMVKLAISLTSCPVMNLIGDVKGKVAVMVDDMIDTAGTIAKGAALLRQEGAREVYACTTHVVFSAEP